MAQASVGITCRSVTLGKTAQTRYSRDYDWSVDKMVVVPESTRAENAASCSANPITDGTLANGGVAYNDDGYLCNDVTIGLNAGGVYDTVYRLAATRSIQGESGFTVSGTITASWPSGTPTPKFAATAVQDTLSFSNATTQSVGPVCGGQGATSLICSYSAETPKLSGSNLASITRIKQCYNSAGVATDCGNQVIDSNQAAFSFGEPAVVTDACTSLADAFNGGAGGPGVLNGGSGFAWDVTSRLCDSFVQYVTGDVVSGQDVLGSFDIRADWMPESAIQNLTCEFMVPNVLGAMFNNQARQDEAVVSVRVPQMCQSGGCTYTQGYWKTHVNYAPKPQFSRKRDATWDLIDGDPTGGPNEDAEFFINAGMSYIQVMWTAPKGNAFYNLAHQYIAAKLNVHAGAGDGVVAADLLSSEGLFGSYPPAHNYWKNKQNRADAIAMAGRLGAYNEGASGPGHCDISPPTSASAL